MIDLYLSGKSGASPGTIAAKIGRNPKAVRRRLEKYHSNEDDCILNYEPFRRSSRRGLRFTVNELNLLEAHRKHCPEVYPKHSARFLCRDVEELTGETRMEVVKAKQVPFAPTLDLIWAYRYIYFIYNKSLISDKAYDTMVHEECEYGGGAGKFLEIKGHQGWPSHIRSLAMYLVEREKWL